MIFFKTLSYFLSYLLTQNIFIFRFHLHFAQFYFLNCRCVAFSLSAMYLWLSYALYVPDWQFMVPASASSLPSSNDSYVYMVRTLSAVSIFLIIMVQLLCSTWWYCFKYEMVCEVLRWNRCHEFVCLCVLMQWESTGKVND